MQRNMSGIWASYMLTKTRHIPRYIHSRRDRRGCNAEIQIIFNKTAANNFPICQLYFTENLTKASNKYFFAELGTRQFFNVAIIDNIFKVYFTRKNTKPVDAPRSPNGVSTLQCTVFRGNATVDNLKQFVSLSLQSWHVPSCT